MIFDISLIYYLVLALILFCIGLLGVLTSKNIIRLLMCVEIMLTSVNINFIAFANYLDLGNRLGDSVAIFVMAVSAIEVAVGLCILICLANYSNNMNIEKQNKTGGRK